MKTNWFIRNGEDEIIARRDDFNGGPYGNNGTYEHEINLNDPSCYKLSATDSDGDGMTGFIRLQDASLQTIGHFAVVGNESEISWESNTVNNVEVINNGNVNIYPNPIKDVISIDYTLGSVVNASYELVNILGQNIESKILGLKSGSNTIRINTEDLDGGVYLLTVHLGDETITERIVK